MNKKWASLYYFLRVAVAGGVLSFAADRLGAVNAPEPFGDGERWCVLGDSITQFGSYHQWVNLFYLTRFPDREIAVFNCGIAGDTAGGALQRLDWDVLVHRPTVVSIMFGMNDVGRDLYEGDQYGIEVVQRRKERLATYRENMRALVEAIQASGARVILLTPSLYDQTAELDSPARVGVNDALAECAEFVHRLADETGASVVDLNGPMARINAALQKNNARATVVGSDRIHPDPAGHFLMAYLILQAQQVSGWISRLAIDLNSNVVTAADGGVVTQIVRGDNTLTFEWAENALPFPVDPSVASAVSWVPFIEEFNHEILQVVGLRPGNYELAIDGEAVSTYDSTTLAAGINLAVETRTPQYRQALDLLRLVQTRAALERDNSRGVAQVEHQLAPQIEHPVTIEQMQPYLEKRLAAFAPSSPAASTRESVELYAQRKESLDLTLASMNRLDRLTRLAAVPRSHLYRLRRVR